MIVNQTIKTLVLVLLTFFIVSQSSYALTVYAAEGEQLYDVDIKVLANTCISGVVYANHQSQEVGVNIGGNKWSFDIAKDGLNVGDNLANIVLDPK